MEFAETIKDAKRNNSVPAVMCVLLLYGLLHTSAGADLVTATNWSGSLGLVLENGVRIKAQGTKSFADLRVDFVCRDGRWDARAWAWFDRMPALEHSVLLTGAEGDSETLRLDFLVEYSSHAPVFAGGTGQYTVELRKALGVIRGDFTGRLGALEGGSSTNLWVVYRGYPLGSAQKPKWPMCIDPGRVNSLRRPDATVLTEIAPLPRAVSGNTPVGRDEHPRLLIGQRDVETFSARFSKGEGAAVAARLAEVLGKQRSEWWNCAGSEAAGWAMLRLAGKDDAMADRAAASARDAMAAMRAKPHSMAYGRNLAGLALAYDLCAGKWPEDFRKTARTELAAAALRLAACLPQVTESDALLAQGQLLNGLSTSHDYRFGYIRAAAGLALLAIEGDGGDVPAERLAAADAAISRSVRRLLREGIGEHGEGTGNNGYADLLEVLLPYLQAYRSVRGYDLAAGTGVEWVGLLGIATKGACFHRGSAYPPGAWVPFILPFVAEEFSAFMGSSAAKMERRFDDPWHGAIAAANWSLARNAAGGVGGMPAILEDLSMGTYVLGGGYADRFLYFRGGAGSDQAGAIRGDVCLYALGREWMSSHAAQPGDFSWPVARDCNTINHLQESKTGHRTAIVPRCGGYIERVRFDHADGVFDGSGSVSMRADTEGMRADRARRSADVFVLDGGGAIPGEAWRTAGVDFSGASGAEVLLVMVEGSLTGELDVEKCWEMDAGSVPADRVVTGPGTFLVSPAGTNASMRGVFIYPAAVDVTYAPPDGKRGGRIRAFLNRKTANRDLSLDHAIRTKAFGADVDADLRTVDEVKKDENRDLLRRKQSSVLFEMLKKEGYTAGNADQRTTNTCVVVITVQQGEPPRVETASKTGGCMVKVGGQTVFYEDSAIVFGLKRRE